MEIQDAQTATAFENFIQEASVDWKRFIFVVGMHQQPNHFKIGAVGNQELESLGFEIAQCIQNKVPKLRTMFRDEFQEGIAIRDWGLFGVPLPTQKQSMQVWAMLDDVEYWRPVLNGCFVGCQVSEPLDFQLVCNMQLLGQLGQNLRVVLSEVTRDKGTLTIQLTENVAHV